MNRVLLAIVIGVLGWQAYSYFREPSPYPEADPAQLPPAEFLRSERHPPQEPFSCDGRTRCSQMTSCEEAEYFLRNCPGVEMDGDNDGVPCESQWCEHLG